MKTLTINTMFAVAALTVAAASASAQTYKAEVPVSFHAGDKLMPAGSYDLRITNTAYGQAMLTVRNNETHLTALLVSVSGRDVPKSWSAKGQPVIAFNCAAGSCSLGRMWNGARSSTFEFPVTKTSGARVDTASLVVTMTKGD